LCGGSLFARRMAFANLGLLALLLSRLSWHTPRRRLRVPKGVPLWLIP
jgi:hypothetical protein